MTICGKTNFEIPPFKLQVNSNFSLYAWGFTQNFKIVYVLFELDQKTCHGD